MPLPYTKFVKTTTIVGAPADTGAGVANGRDPLGCALSNASYDHTGGGSGERQLTAASGTPFSSVQAGDYIYLLNAAGGVANGLYEIASVPSSTVILLVADSGLTADSTGDVDSSDGPYATLQYAFDNSTVGGDILVICDDGNGTAGVWQSGAGRPTFDVDTGAPSYIEPIAYRGGNSRGVVDGTVATISGAGLGLFVYCVTVSGGSVKRRWQDLRFTATPLGHNFYCADSTSTDHQFIRCQFDNAVLAGIAAKPNDWHFIDCEFNNNGTWGRLPDTASTSGAARGNYLRCRFHDNTNGGMQLTSQAFISQCLFYDNGGPGLRLFDHCENVIIDGCVFFGNGTDGVEGSGTLVGMSPAVITNSVFRSNGAYGIDMASMTLPVSVDGAFWAEVDYTCFHNNTSGKTANALNANIFGNSSGDHNVYSDPVFVSETDGSEDFTPQASSPLIDAGISSEVN